MRVRELNLLLSKMLGVDTERVRGFDLKVRAGQVPTLTVEKYYVDGRALVEVDQLFDLVPREPEPEPAPFDLERACEAAMRRVRAQVEISAYLAVSQLDLLAARRESARRN